MFSGTSNGCIEPAVVVFVAFFKGNIAGVDEDVLPLSALRFVAGDGVGKAYL